MGASWFEINARGTSLKDAYGTATSMAEYDDGHDSYNGTISTTHGCDDLTEQFKRSGKTLNQYLEMQMDKMHKRDCAAICIEKPVANTNKTKSQVEHIVTPGTKKWVLQYAILNDSNDVLSAHATKGDAVRIARYHTEKTQQPTKIIMRKVLEDGNPLVARITYKQSSTEKSGRWMFFGWAAE